MTVRYSYLATAEDHKLVADWFASIAEERVTDDRADRIVHYFRAMANCPLPLSDDIDQEKTPLVFIQKPRMLRGTLWTDAEVLFTPTPLKSQFPALQPISQSFSKWLKDFDMIFSQKPDGPSEWNYYLEAGIQNYVTELYALPGAMRLLKAGQYFVYHKASPSHLDKLAHALRLRGHPID